MAEVINQGVENERLMEPEGSAKIYLRRRNPFGFWYVQFERGVTPESLSSAFTTIDMAKQAVNAYLNNSPVRKRAASKE